MKDFLLRAAFRVAILAFVPFLFLSWALAVPYAMLDVWTRREHFESFGEMTSRDSWAGLWDALKRGRG